MALIDWSSIVSLLISKSQDLLFGAAAGAIAGYLTSTFSVRSEKKKLVAKLEQDLLGEALRRRNDILEEVWKKAAYAVDAVEDVTNPYLHYPDFSHMSAEQANERLQVSWLTEWQKRELLESHDKGKYYGEAKFWHDVSEARKAVLEVGILVEQNKLRIPADICERLRSLVTLLGGSLETFDIWHRAPSPQLMEHVRQGVRAAREELSGIEKLMRALLEPSTA